MLDTIITLDRELFYILNTVLVAPFLDYFMPFITRKANFIALIAFMWTVGFVWGDRRDKYILIMVVVLVVVSDMTSSFLKEVFSRERPCHALDGIRLLVGCGGSYSFPSSHATNIFASMVFLAKKYRIFYPLFLAIAFVVAYSRIYVGVHYPLDVVAGALVGTTCALAFDRIDRDIIPWLREYMKKRRETIEV